MSNEGLAVKLETLLHDESIVEIIRTTEQYNNNVVALREAYGTTIDSDEDEWRKLTGNSKRDLPSITQQRMREVGLYLWESNLLANRLIELPLAFMLAEGVKVKSDEEIVQEMIDEFWNDPINMMDLKLVKKARELSIFGEQFYPAFTNDFNGHVRIGYLDPSLVETIVTDPDNGEQPIGVITTKDKKGNARRYKVICNGAEKDLFTQRTQEIRATFTDGELFYFSINSLSNGKRGRSDLLGHIDWLDAYDQFLFGELERAGLQRSFIWDVLMTGATPEEVLQRAKEITPPAANSVRVHNEGEMWTAVTPDLKAGDSDNMARLFRNHVMGGSTLPEHWYGGATDVNRATGDSMGEPTFKNFAMRQTFLGYMLETIVKYVIRQKELRQTGSEPDLNDPIYSIRVEWPEMIARDTTKYAAALQQVVVSVGMAVDREFMSRTTALSIIEKIAGRLGVEFDVEDELDKATADADKKKEADVIPPLPEDDDDELGGVIDPIKAAEAGALPADA